MKIVHIVESFAGGVYDFLVNLTNGMSEFEHFIVYGKRYNTPKNFKKDFPKITRFFHWKNAIREINLKKDTLALVELVKILNLIGDMDVVHLHSSKAGFIGRLAARLLGIQDKVIYTSHGVSFLRRDVSFLKRKQYELLEKMASKLGGKIIACSKSEAEEFRKIGIDADFIFNGIDTSKCSLQNIAKYSKAELIIGTIGRITYPKNPKIFNSIAEKFIKYKNVKFLWIGDGELKDELLSPNIEVTGWMDRDKVFRRLLQVDIYLSTSLWEGLPLSVLQAMCAAKPLVLSDCVGNVDLVSNNGIIFKTLEEAVISLKKLIEDPYRREILGRNSCKLVRNKFSLKRMIEGYKKLYFDIAKFKKGEYSFERGK